MKNYDKVLKKYFCPKREQYMKWFDGLEYGKMIGVNAQSSLLGICSNTISLMLKELVREDKVRRVQRYGSRFVYIKVKPIKSDSVKLNQNYLDKFKARGLMKI